MTSTPGAATKLSHEVRHRLPGSPTNCKTFIPASRRRQYRIQKGTVGVCPWAFTARQRDRRAARGFPSSQNHLEMHRQGSRQGSRECSSSGVPVAGECRHRISVLSVITHRESSPRPRPAPRPMGDLMLLSAARRCDPEGLAASTGRSVQLLPWSAPMQGALHQRQVLCTQGLNTGASSRRFKTAAS
jgi:hypothetical protein